MKIHLSSDTAPIAQVLTDLLATAGHEVTDANDADATLGYEGKSLQITVGGICYPVGCPVHPTELLQFLSGKMRHPALALAAGWQLDVPGRTLMRAGETLSLTEKECLLLTALAAALPGAASREQLLKKVWAYDGDIETHTLETHIYRLRTKLSELKPSPCDIVTHGGSYRLEIA